MALTIEALPAAQGDALLLRWGSSTSPTTMLVDGGPWSTYKALRARVEQLPRPRRLDVLVVTHIDGDHIEGVIRLLRDRRALGLTIGDVWFNGWPQLRCLSGESDRLGAEQGEFLGALLRRSKVPWNGGRDGPLAVPDDGPPPVLDLPGGATATVLGPLLSDLRRLRREWSSAIRASGWQPGDTARALSELEGRRRLRASKDLLGGEPATDSSLPNRTSTVLLLEADGARVLLTGDAHGDMLAQVVGSAARAAGTDALAVDLVKLPHHGSPANVTEPFLATVDSRRFLFSTNGAYYKHPGGTAVRRLLERAGGAVDPVELLFNYDSETTRSWTSERWARRRSYAARYPEPGQAGLLVSC